MKTLLTIATLALTATTIVGCQAPAHETPSHPMTSDSLSQLQAEFSQADAGAKVGSVDDVKADVMFLAVGQITGTDFPVGTVVAIIDSNKQTIAFGTVEQVFDTTVHVKYQSKAGQRAPMVGDVAVKFTEKF